MTKIKKYRLIAEVKEILLSSQEKIGRIADILKYKHASTIEHYIKTDVGKLLQPEGLEAIYQVLEVPIGTAILEEYYVDKDNHLRDN
jgi:hypothetical protein